MTTIFGNPGSTELPMLADFPDDFSYVLGLQELVVVGMADGYAQATGRPTHVNLHTAPGVGNAVGGIFNAQANKSPLVITAGQQVRAADHDRGEPDQPRRRRRPAAVREVEPRATAGPGRAGAIARAIHHASLPPRGPAFVSIPMDDWDAEADPDRARTRPGADGRPAARRPTRTRWPSWPRRSPRPRNPVLVAGPDIDASGGWDAAVALAERQRLPVWATPATGGGRLGFPENHPNFVGILPPGIGPISETLKEHDLVLVVGSSVFPYYPYIPGPLLAEGTTLVAITSDPAEAARAPMGDAIVGDVALGAARAARARAAERERPAPSPLPGPATRRGRPDERLGGDGGARRCLAARTRSPCSRRPPAPLPFATGCASRARELLLQRQRRPGLRDLGRRRRPAGAAGPAGGVRARRGLGAVRDHRAVERGGLQACRSPSSSCATRST